MLLLGLLPLVHPDCFHLELLKPPQFPIILLLELQLYLPSERCRIEHLSGLIAPQLVPVLFFQEIKLLLNGHLELPIICLNLPILVPHILAQRDESVDDILQDRGSDVKL